MREFIRYSKAPEAETQNLPDRETIINRDDILNLKIALEVSSDVLEFVQDQHIFDSPQ